MQHGVHRLNSACKHPDAALLGGFEPRIRIVVARHRCPVRGEIVGSRGSGQTHCTEEVTPRKFNFLRTIILLLAARSRLYGILRTAARDASGKKKTYKRNECETLDCHDLLVFYEDNSAFTEERHGQCPFACTIHAVNMSAISATCHRYSVCSRHHLPRP